MRRAAALAIVSLACAGAPARTGGPFVDPGFSADRLAGEDVAVLPLGGVTLPEATAARDSLQNALGRFVDAGLATALAVTGAAGRALSPMETAPALVALGPEGLARLHAALDALSPEDPGRLENVVAEDLEGFAEVADVRFLLVPRRLVLEPAGAFRFEARLTVGLVDARAGRVLWLETVRAAPGTPPPGDAPDLTAAAIAEAAAAAVGRTARRLAELARK